MRKIHVLRQFCEARGRHSDFFEKWSMEVCAKFQVCIVFRVARRRDTNPCTHIQVKLGISLTGSLPHVDFENLMWEKNCKVRKNVSNESQFKGGGVVKK